MASSLIDAIKETIIGVKSNAIDGIIDRSLESISQYSSNSDTNKYLESMKNLVSSSGMSKDNSVIKQLDQGAPQVQNFDQSGRVARYAEYDAVCTKIAYVQRAIKVLTDHIIAPDDILKYALQVIPVDRNSKETKIDIAITRIKEIIKHFKLENKIKNLVFDTLKYGDNFVEIVPVPKGKNALVVINEGMDYNAFRDTKVISETKVTLETTNEKNVTESKDIRIVVDESIIETLDGNGQTVLTEDLIQTSNIGFGGVLSSMSSNVMTPYGTGSQMVKNVGDIVNGCKSKDDHPVEKVNDDKFKSKYSNIDNQDDKKEDENRLDIKDVNIVIHDPRYVIRLETERFKVCLGFLVFPKVDPTTLMSQGANTNIDAICANFLGDIESKLKLNERKDNIKISDDIRKVLLVHLSKIKRNEDLKVRYVAPEYMEHFRINVSKYAPYGESILDSSLYDCKLLMALKTAAAIKKINACTDKRFVSVEVGLPRDAKNVVQKMEEILTKKRVSIGSMGAIDTIPSQISTLETIFLPMKDGKKFVEIDHQNWGGDTSNDTDNQKQMRDGIVANLGVPPIFVGLEENCLPYNTEIKLLDGSSEKIGRIVELWENNENNRDIWVYSCDPQTKKMVPGKVSNVFRTRKNAQLVRVHLDNGKYVDCTPDHKFMLRNGSYLEARYLKEDDSLMPLYLRDTNSKVRSGSAYYEVYDPFSGSWRLVHRMVTEELNRVINRSRLHVHHIDRNPKNNHPNNLLVCTATEHIAIHSKLKNMDYNGKILYEISDTKLLDTRKCIICGNDFQCLIHSNRVTCGKTECKKERARIDGYKSWNRLKCLHPELESVNATCSICGKIFKTSQSHLKNRNENHNGLLSCSKQCGRKLSALIQKENAKIKNHYRKSNCVICGKEIMIDDHNLTNTCSIKCANTVLSRKRWKGNVKEYRCIFCGKYIKLSKWTHDNMAHVHCHECGKYSTGYTKFLKKNPVFTIQDYIEKMNIPQYMNHKVVSIEWLSEKQDCYDIEVDKWHNFGLTSGIIVHNSSNRSSATTESISFCRTIIDDQKELSIPMQELITKVYRLIFGDLEADILSRIQITFSEPKVLPNTAKSEYLEAMQRNMDAYNGMGIPKSYLQRKFLPDLEWNEIENAVASEKLDAELNDTINNGGDMMGGMNLGTSPSMGGMPGGF